MNYLQIFFITLTQAFTELLPISSSMHVKMVYDHFNMNNTGYTLGIIQNLCDIGSITAIGIFYKKYFYFNKKNINLSPKIAIAILPMVLAHVIEDLYMPRNILYKYSDIIFIIFGIIYMLIDISMTTNDKRGVYDIRYREFFIVGVSQIFALLYGTSRLGITYSTLRLMQFNRKTSITASFLLGLTTHTANTIISITGLEKLENLYNTELLALPILTAIFTVPFIYIILKYTEKYGIALFCIYRIILGLFLILQKQNIL